MGTLVTREVDYPAEVKVEESGIELILGGHRELKVFEVKKNSHNQKSRQFDWLFGKA